MTISPPEQDHEKIRKQLAERKKRLQKTGKLNTDEQSGSNTPRRISKPKTPSTNRDPGNEEGMTRRKFLRLFAIALGATAGASVYESDALGISRWFRKLLFGPRNNDTIVTNTPEPTIYPSEPPTPTQYPEPKPTEIPTSQPEPTETPSEPDPILEYEGFFGNPVRYDHYGVHVPAIAAIRHKTNPLERPIYYGFTPNNQDWNPDQRSIDESMHLGEKAPSIIQFYQDWGENPQGSQFQSAWLDRIRQQGAIPNITWMPGDARFWGQKNHPDFQKFSLKNIAEGQFDTYIQQWARAARDWGHPFFLRFGHEMNGNDKWWPYPWLTAMNPDTHQALNSPPEFVQAWRHVHDIFTQVGANNVTWVWCPDSAGNITSEFLQTLYPGDDYVDWVSTDIYEWGDEKPGDNFVNNFVTIYNRLLEIAPQKPIMLSEFGSQQHPEEKALWMHEFFLKYLPWLFPQVQAVIYFDKDKRDEGRTWRVNTSEQTQQAFAQALSSRYFATDTIQQPTQSPIPLAQTLS